MRQLYINNHLAVMAESDNFTLHSENPFFTNAGDYTFEVSLPLEGCAQNQRIFGSLHRMETAVAPFVGQKYDFRLVVPPLYLTGKAIITSITDTDIRVQLLAGTSGFNADTIEERGKDIYIDEMDLGKAYENTYPDAYAKGDRFIFDGEYISPRSVLLEDLYLEKNMNILYGTNSETECVSYAVWSEADQAKSNNKQLYHDKNGADLLKPNANNHLTEPYFAAQPFLINIVEKVVESLGYHVRDNAVRGTWMENIFIANVKNEYKYNRILPHWTVKEFLEEVRNFFGIFFFVDGNEIDFVTKSDYYSNAERMMHLDHVVDEHTIELNEDDDAEDASFSNIGYDLPSSDNLLQIPEDVWENAIIIKMYNEQLINDWISKHLQPSDYQKSAWIFVDKSTNRCFAFLQTATDTEYRYVQVDCCPPLIRRGNQFGPGKRDIDISLRIVPAKMDFRNIDYMEYAPAGAHVFDKAVSLPMLLSDSTREGFLNVFSVDAAINDLSQVDNAENDLTCIEVALATGETFRTSFSAGGKSYQIDVPMAVGIGYVKWDDGLYHSMVSLGNKDQFILTNKKAPSIYDSVLNMKYKIDTRCKHIIEFVEDGVVSPNQIFLIRGKKFACEKIEYTITSDGIDKKKKGHFYEIG